ncbi:MAG: hypothetical protein J0I48_10790 [Devosia sp.]|uniref:hypothetical protein n=1 Tax=Devosia sp. 66-22 TaxID=1895753 RepID=UPI000AA18988|nr:hypothetical protein [Devosia sp. 66-22]MBN9346667.1 hypothetical protein [Devosia sp.]
MADYKELLRRAVEALPENNGAARRAVYEKARAALVGQLRAINPPLPARDITTHRLQLEDCIRQVEQEASEANIAGLTSEPPSLPPVFAAEAKKPVAELPKPAAKPAAPAPKAAIPAAKQPPVQKALPKAEPPRAPKPELVARSKTNGTASIEDIIAAAERDREPPAPKAPEIKNRPPKSQPMLVKPHEEPEDDEADEEPMRPAPRKQEQRQLPSIVARAEASKGRGAAVSPGFGVAIENGRRGPTIEPRRDGGRGMAAAARQVDPIEFDVDEDVQAMAAVREVEVEPQQADPQGAIDRAIATLDREARGDNRPAHYTESEVDLDDEDEPMQAPVRNGLFNGKANGKANGRSTGTDLVISRGDRGVPFEQERERPAKAPRPAKEFANPRRAQAARAFDGIPRAQSERGGMGAVTIFLIIFAALLVGAGGAGFWAWQEGFINLDQMFGKGTPAVTTAATQTPVSTDSNGPGNTETPAAATPATELKANERLPAVTDTAATESVEPLALQTPTGDAKIEERLGSETSAAADTAEQAIAAIDPSTVAGSQSLLLEASDNGTTGAVPFSGTVDWSKGQDEMGQPTLVGKANIPARNLSVEVLIRKNSDPSLPASHLMEINFTVTDTFIGGSIAGLPGVLLKNEELVQGAPLVGASARVVGNSFLFALSAASEDTTANTNLLTSRKWMDLALIYASGKRAIITLEKDPAAQALFSDVFSAWGNAPASQG